LKLHSVVPSEYQKKRGPLPLLAGIKSFGALLKLTLRRFSDDKVMRMAAALSYYTTFSLAPLLILAIAMAGMVFGREAAQGQIMAQISGLVGTESAAAIQSMIEAANRPAAGAIATVIGIVTLLFGATGVFSELRDGLNDIWDVEDRSGLGTILKKRAKLFGMVLGIGFLLIVSLVVSAGVAGLGATLSGYLPIPEYVLHLLDFAVSFGIISMLFATLYKFLPNTRVAWHDVWIGSTATAFLFVVGKLILGIYLGKGSVASSYGAAGSVLIILLWVYYSGIILYIGAEFTRVYAERHGSRRDQPQPVKEPHEARSLRSQAGRHRPPQRH